MSLRAGYAQSVITPGLERPVYLAGFGRDRQAISVHDELYARALALLWEEGCLVVMALDLLGLGRHRCQGVEKQLRASQSAAQLLLCCTHTHHGPDTIGLWGPDELTSGVDPVYLDQLAGRTLATAKEAIARAEPASLRAASVEVSGLAKNSRDPGIVDEELTCLQFCRPDDGRILANWLIYPCHPEVLWDDNPHITSDYLAAMRKEMEQVTGGPCLGQVGALGGMMTPDVQDHSYEEAEAMGIALARAAQQAISAATFKPVTRFRYHRHEFRTPLENPLFHAAIAAGLLADLRGPDGELTSEASLLQLNDTWLFGVPGELLPALGMAYKARMRREGASHAGIVGLANDELGYILPEDAFYYPADPLDPGAHYEETMSAGKGIASQLGRALEGLIDG